MDTLNDATNGRAFTKKALFFGFVGVFLIAGVAGFNDYYLEQTLFINNHFPIAGYFYMAMVVLGWNLLCSRIKPNLMLSTHELVVVLAMTLSACFVPSSSFYRHFHRQLILPLYYAAGQPVWQKLKLIDYLPSYLFPLNGDVMHEAYDKVYMGFVQGLSKNQGFIPLWQMPIGAWIKPMLWWGPLVILMSLCVISLSMLVHRQWVHHEQLSYPIATVATSLLKRDENKPLSAIFYSRLFWTGALFVMFIYTIKLLAGWFPGVVPDINLTFNFTNKIWTKIPIAHKVGDAGGANWLGTQTLYFTVLGLAYFIASGIGLTMGLAQILIFLVAMQFYMITGKPFTGLNASHFRSGAYIGYALILLYIGRDYYTSVLKKAFGWGAPTEHDRESVIACRITLLSFLGFVLVMQIMGLDLFIAFCFALSTILLFLVFTRIICETGIPFMQAGWSPGSFLSGMFGTACIGAGPLVFIYYLGTVLCQDPRECLMPFVATSLKVADDNKVSRLKTMFLTFGGAVVALVVGFVVTLWIFYSVGGITTNDDYASRHVPTQPFDSVARDLTRLEDLGMIETSQATQGLAKLSYLRPETDVWPFFTAGLITIGIFSFLRFRFMKFPIHPVLFLVWGTYPSNRMWYSFLLGWFIKELVVKFGGGRAYQQLKPLFIGLILGELLVGGIAILIGFGYYWITGLDPTFKLIILPE